MRRQKSIEKSFKSREPRIFFELGDASNILNKYLDMKFDLVITSPPYNIGKEYEKKKEIEDYLAEQEEIIEKIVNLLSVADLY